MLSKIKETIGLRISKLLLLFSATLFFLVITAFCLEDVIGNKIVDEIQSGIKTNLKVGAANFSLIASFPYASLNLKNVVIQGNDRSDMLKAGSIRFKINVLSLFSEQIKIKALSVRDAAILMKTEENGDSNYDIIRAGDPEPKTEVAFLLENATFKNVIVGYQHAGNHEDAGFTINSAAFKGAFSEKVFNLSSKADLVCHGISRAGQSFLVDKSIAYKTNLKVDRIRNSYDIGTFSIALEDNKFDVKGKASLSPKASNVDLQFKASNCNIGSLLSIFPQARLKDLSSEGDLSVTGTIKGTQSATSRPELNAEIRLVNGTIKSPKLIGSLEKVNFYAKLYTSNGESSLSMDNFRGFFAGQPLELKLAVNNFGNPYVNLSLNGKIPLSSTYKMFGMPNLQSAGGSFALRQIQVAGLLQDMKSANGIGRVNMSGTLGAENISMLLNNESVSIRGGALHFDNNTVSAEALEIAGAGSRFTLSGYLNNLLPVLLKDSPQQVAKLGFRLKLESAGLDVKRLSALFQEKPQITASAKSSDSHNTSTARPATSLLNGVVEANIQNISYGKIKGKRFDGNISFENNYMIMRGSVETMQGNVNLNGKLSLAGSPVATAVIDGANINTALLFEQCENFGQQVIQSHNISGRMDCQLALEAFFDRNWNFLEDKLHVLAYLRMNNGQLKGLKMADNLSTYVKTEDLRNIRFNTLENWFEVSNGSIRIPAMNIKSSAINLTLSGNHTFENYIDYNIRLNAADVIMSRFKKSTDTRDNSDEAGQFGLLNVFLNLNGPMDNYKVQMSRKVVKNDFEESNLQKSRIQSRLKSLHNGKEILIPEYPAEPDYRPDFKTVSNLPKTGKKKPSERTEEKLEYIEGF